MTEVVQSAQTATSSTQDSLRDLKRRLIDLKLEAVRRGYGTDADVSPDDLDAIAVDASRGLAQRRLDRDDFVGALVWEMTTESASEQCADPVQDKHHGRTDIVDLRRGFHNG